MQSQPFTLDYLCEFRQSDLQAAALDVRSKRYSGQPNLRGRLAARMAALVGRRPQLGAHASATSTSARPIVQ